MRFVSGQKLTNLLAPLGTALFVSALLTVSGSARAADDEVQLVIENHRFTPAEVRVPAQKKIKLVVENKDATAEEFESHSLNREKLIPAKSKVTIFVGPLKPGSYKFFGEFHEKTAQGVLIAQ